MNSLLFPDPQLLWLLLYECLHNWNHPQGKFSLCIFASLFFNIKWNSQFFQFQMIAHGFLLHEGAFLRSMFNLLDLIVVFVALISFVLEYDFSEFWLAHQWPWHTDQCDSLNFTATRLSLPSKFSVCWESSVRCVLSTEQRVWRFV